MIRFSDGTPLNNKSGVQNKNEKKTLPMVMAASSMIFLLIMPALINSVYAQITTPQQQQSETARARTYGPQAAQVATENNATINVTVPRANISTTLNNTITNGIENMERLLVLGPEIRNAGLVEQFNNAFMAFGYIHRNVTELHEFYANQTNIVRNESSTQITELQQQLTTARQSLQTTQQQLAATNTDLNEANERIADLEVRVQVAEGAVRAAEEAQEDEDEQGASSSSDDDDDSAAVVVDDGEGTAQVQENEQQGPQQEDLENLVSNDNPQGFRLDPEGDGGPDADD
jgi:hypothetical protein